MLYQILIIIIVEVKQKYVIKIQNQDQKIHNFHKMNKINITVIYNVKIMK